jgi:hypothetical protein
VRKRHEVAQVVASRNQPVDVEDILSRSPEARAIPDSRSILDRWLKMSEEVWLGTYDGQVACVWGLVPPSIISNRVYLWLLTTDLAEQHKFIFVRQSQLAIENAFRRYDVIVGHVEVGNCAARRWLRWLGADIGVPENGFSTFKIRRRQ